MTPEQIDRTFQFILEHQAQATINIERASADIQKLSANIQQLSAYTQRLSDTTQQLSANTQQLSAAFLSEQTRTQHMGSLLVTMTELVQIQSRRLDGHDEDFRVVHTQNAECLTRLDQILRKIKETN